MTGTLLSPRAARKTRKAVEQLAGIPEVVLRADPTSGMTPYPDQFVAIELDEDIPEVHNPDDEYDGSIRDWDPTADAGEGGYSANVSVTLRDTLEMKIYGSSGAKGIGRIRYKADGTYFVELWGLECP